MKINLLLPIQLGIMLYCGITGKVDWIVISLIILSQIRLDLTFRDKTHK